MVGRLVDDAVHDRVAHVEVRVRHVDLGAQDARAIGEFAVLHALEQVHVLFHIAVAVGRIFTRLGEGAAVGTDLFRTLVIDIGLAHQHKLLGPFV